MNPLYSLGSKDVVPGNQKFFKDQSQKKGSGEGWGVGKGGEKKGRKERRKKEGEEERSEEENERKTAPKYARQLQNENTCLSLLKNIQEFQDS